MEKLKNWRNYGPEFWGAACFSLSVLTAFWLESFGGTGEIINEFLKWAIEPFLGSINLKINEIAVSIPLSPLLIIVAIYVMNNFKQRRLNQNYVEKPGEYIVALYIISLGLMISLSYFLEIKPLKEFRDYCVYLLFAIYFPSQILKRVGIKNENNNAELKR